jgi:hypothetical protein
MPSTSIARSLRGFAAHYGLVGDQPATISPQGLLFADLDLYLRSDRRRVQWVEGSVAVAAGGGGNVTFTAGVDEIWHVHAVTAINPANFLNSFIGWGIRPAGTALLAGQGYGFLPEQYAPGAVEVTNGQLFPVPFVLAGGDQILARFGNLSAGVVTCSGAILREIITNP